MAEISLCMYVCVCVRMSVYSTTFSPEFQVASADRPMVSFLDQHPSVSLVSFAPPHPHNTVFFWNAF